MIPTRYDTILALPHSAVLISQNASSSSIRGILKAWRPSFSHCTFQHNSPLRIHFNDSWTSNAWRISFSHCTFRRTFGTLPSSLLAFLCIGEKTLHVGTFCMDRFFWRLQSRHTLLSWSSSRKLFCMLVHSALEGSPGNSTSAYASFPAHHPVSTAQQIDAHNSLLVFVEETILYGWYALHGWLSWRFHFRHTLLCTSFRSTARQKWIWLGGGTDTEQFHMQDGC